MVAVHAPGEELVLPCVGVPITACTRSQAAEAVVALALAPRRHGSDVHLCNAYTLALADKLPPFLEMLNRATHNFPDGKAVVWANILKHRDVAVPNERVYGPDLFLDVLERGVQPGVRHYLVGGTPEVLTALVAAVRARFPAAQLVGYESPPFRPLTDQESEDQVARLTASGAQVVWLGLGTPKQDWEAARLATRVPAVVCAVGAAFDFVAGAKRQAPPWMQRHGLEWLHRLGTEPRRLWKRYLFGNVRFLAATARAR